MRAAMLVSRPFQLTRAANIMYRSLSGATIGAEKVQSDESPAPPTNTKPSRNSKLQRDLDKSLKRMDWPSLERCLAQTREAGMKLTHGQEYSIVKFSAHRPMIRPLAREADAIFSAVKDANRVTEPILAEMLYRSAYVRASKEQDKLLELYSKHGYAMSDLLVNRLLSRRFRPDNNGGAARHFLRFIKKQSAEKKWDISKTTFNRIFRSYVDGRMVGGFLFLDLVLDMYEDHGYTLSARQADELLTAAMDRVDQGATEAVLSKALTVLIQSGSQTRSAFNTGRITRLLEVACAARGRPEIARVALEWANALGVEPRDVDMTLWVRSSLIANQFTDAVEVLILTEKSGLDLRNGPYGSWLHREFAVQLYKATRARNRKLGKDDSFNSSVLDELRDALVRLVRTDYVVPALALDAMMTCEGMLNRYEEAFVLFSDYSELYGCHHDTVTYNALMGGLAYGGFFNSQRIMNVMDKMETEGISPDGVSVTHLLNSLAPGINKLSPEELGSILDSIEENKLKPLPFALARLAGIMSLKFEDDSTMQSVIERIQEMVELETGNPLAHLDSSEFEAVPKAYNYLYVCNTEQLKEQVKMEDS